MRHNVPATRFGLLALAVMWTSASSLQANFIAMSNFSVNDEGWLLEGDSTTTAPTYVTTGGNPGGYIHGTDEVLGGVWFWQAPAKFLGNDSAAYGQTLTYDERMRGTGPLFDDSDVILEGAGLSLHFDTSPLPADVTWTHYNVLLSETAGWKVGSLAGPAATQAQIQAVLADVTSLRIRGEFIVGPDNGDLDNVVLNAPPTTTSSVPEPNSLVLLMSLSVLGCLMWRRKS